MQNKLRNKILRDAIRLRHDGLDELLASCSASPDKLNALEYWIAKGCLDVSRAWGGKILSISVTPKGFTYFDDKREARAAFWRERCVNFIGGFVSGVLTTLCATWLIQRLL